MDTGPCFSPQYWDCTQGHPTTDLHSQPLFKDLRWGVTKMLRLTWNLPWPPGLLGLPACTVMPGCAHWFWGQLVTQQQLGDTDGHPGGKGKSDGGVASERAVS